MLVKILDEEKHPVFIDPDYVLSIAQAVDNENIRVVTLRDHIVVGSPLSIEELVNIINEATGGEEPNPIIGFKPENEPQKPKPVQMHKVTIQFNEKASIKTISDIIQILIELKIICSEKPNVFATICEMLQNRQQPWTVCIKPFNDASKIYKMLQQVDGITTKIGKVDGQA